MGKERVQRRQKGRNVKEEEIARGKRGMLGDA